MMLAVFVTLMLVINTGDAALPKKFCGDPSPHQCVVNPCLFVTCKMEPNATCSDYMCGTLCMPLFYYNDEDVTSRCDADLVANGMATGTNAPNAKTGSSTGATNTVAGSGSLSGTSSNSITGGSSPLYDALLANAESLGLLSNTDMGTSAGTNTNTIGSGSSSSGSLSSSSAGSAAASSVTSLFDALHLSSANSQTSESSCPNGVQKVACSIPPCQVTTCPGLSAATCKDNFCGGCKAEFWIGPTEVTSLCQQQQQQQEQQQPLVPQTQSGPSLGPQLSKSFATLAAGTLSGSETNANLLTGLGSGLTVGQQQTTSGGGGGGVSGTTGSADCPANRMATCDSAALCKLSPCASVADVTCRVSNCGGCFAKYHFNGQDVTARCLTPQQQLLQQQQKQQQQLQQQHLLQQQRQQQLQQQQQLLQQQRQQQLQQQQQLLQKQRQQQLQLQQQRQQQQRTGVRNTNRQQQQGRQMSPWYYMMLPMMMGM